MFPGRPTRLESQGFIGGRNRLRMYQAEADWLASKEPAERKVIAVIDDLPKFAVLPVP